MKEIGTKENLLQKRQKKKKNLKKEQYIYFVLAKGSVEKMVSDRTDWNRN